MRKRLEILGGQGNGKTPETPRKRLEITWDQQKNASDCGPLSILHALIRVNFLGRPRSLQEIRDAVALRRQRDGQPLTARVGGDIRTTGWFTSFDIRNYLKDSGIPADILSNKPDIDGVKEKLFSNPRKFYILATGNHFKVIRYTGQGEIFELLDSFQNGPQSLSKQAAYNLLDQSIGLAGVLAG